ncbi:sugar ABC transporter ATP-binding protein [Aureimonas endophytica]|uniref:Sugar ABC transporter ATP-binding protein n=1 Tax=Aureimonas endophytica TaxID=2027858 RepID=A0A917EC07_9HYPH|nr:sn-glycerol-3-phosphate ABC transporter ATP-binding protein UgpC [Aureimonas endophytica]GGE22603.1 sugar ABC transporter ATP-binding protein [Aureimonas endophytica]
MAAIDIAELRKSYGRDEVIHGVDLKVADGEFVSLIGASGCGKSTLLRMIAGLEDVTSGTIRLGGRVINDVEPKDRDVAMVFQNYALYPHLTVAENMGFSLKLRNVAKPEIRRAVEETAEVLGLAPYLDRLPRALSGGQRQRVAMGRAIVRRPQAFLFDEPLSNLDAKLRVQMRVEIKALQKRLGTTSIYVTHDQLEAMTMSDRIVILNGGRVEQAGAPLELYDRPANLFVATFIGTPVMNLVHGTAVAEGNGLRLETNSGRIPLPAGLAVAEGQALVYGIRAEHLDLTGEAGPDTLPFELELVEPTGSETHLYGRLCGTAGTVIQRDRAPLAPGRLTVRPQADHIHLFDARTGRRLGA